MTFGDLLDCLEEGGNPNKVKSPWFRKNLNIVENPDRPFIGHLGALNYPETNIINLDECSRESGFSKPKPAKIVVASCGRRYDCRFCFSKYF